MMHRQGTVPDRSEDDDSDDSESESDEPMFESGPSKKKKLKLDDS